jgi:tRNA U34 5-methylaminomethyl-2-thiouridine-forming methyltransferase MnmC
LFTLVYSHIYFKFCKSAIHNQLIVSGTVTNYTNNTPFCSCSIILFQLTLMNVSQRNVSKNQQLHYFQTQNLLFHSIALSPPHSHHCVSTANRTALLLCPSLTVFPFLSLFHPPVTNGSIKYTETLNL